MKWKDLSTDSTPLKHSEQFLDWYGAVAKRMTLTDYLKGFDFESRDEIKDAITQLNYNIVLERQRTERSDRKEDAILDLVKRQAEVITSQQGRLEKLATTLSGDLWHQYFAPRIREQRFASMFGGTANTAAYEDAAWRLMQVYDLTYADIEKLRFFVEQVKARDNFPPSLRRMLYIWGRTKKTGKTTCAKMVVSTLNGSDAWQTADPDFTTTLANEMQIGGFKVPKIASCECCMMDECFYSDMGKTYHDFKRFLTSSGGSARLPYGQEFQWTGRPNYVATSNEPLSSFIKDWGDRRFLSIEFKSSPREVLSFDDIHALWRSFIVNSTRRYDSWQQWSEDIARYSDEVGEKAVMSNEYEVEMRKPEFLGWLCDKPDGKSATSADNQFTLFNVVNFFKEREGNLAQSHRKEIEAAFISVFGERLEGYRFWRLDVVKQQAAVMLFKIKETPF